MLEIEILREMVNNNNNNKNNVVYDAQSKPKARLSTVIKDGNLNRRPTRSEQMVDIQSNLYLVKIGEKDKPKWVVSKFGIYSSSQID